MSRRNHAVVLLSGGVDSTTVLALAKEQEFEVHALSFRYGQRHAIELAAADRVARQFGVAEHRVIEFDLKAFGGSALTGELAVPRHGETEVGHVPVTYVPARNTIFLSFALAWAEVLGAQDIFVGANANDAAGYPDCRPAFLRAFEIMADLATREGVDGRQRLTIHAPLCALSKTDTIRLGVRLGVRFGDTWSCYDPTPDDRPCRVCDACALRERAFEEIGLVDPLVAQALT